MKKSIQRKLLLYMMINILVFATLLYGSNYLFGKTYHLNHKKDLLIETSQKINTLLANKSTSLPLSPDAQLAMNRLERGIGASVTIGSPDGEIYFPNPDNNGLHRRNGMGMLNPFFQRNLQDSHNQLILQTGMGSGHLMIQDWEQVDEDSVFGQVEDPNLGIDTLRYQTVLDNGLLLLIWIPMSEISDSIAITNRFTSIIGLITILITGFWSFFVSRRFTRPIQDMNIIAKEMSNLDFSKTLEINGEDEIAQLSRTINELSGKLSSTISDLDAKNQQLEEDIDQERRLVRMRKEFISNVSHELKTPIFLIQGYAEGLKTNIDTNVEKREFYTDVIIEETEKMNHIVRDLLDLSQMEAGSFSVTKCSFDICELTQDILRKIEPILADKSIQPQVEMNAPLFVLGDPVRIEQVIVNYINNGLNHVDERKEIHISIKKITDKVRFTLFNSGANIPADSLDKIWTSFYKVDQSRTREYGGTGLGLSIVRSILEAHENQYGVNNLENGVAFWFELDVATM